MRANGPPAAAAPTYQVHNGRFYCAKRRGKRFENVSGAYFNYCLRSRPWLTPRRAARINYGRFSERLWPWPAELIVSGRDGITLYVYYRSSVVVQSNDVVFREICVFTVWGEYVQNVRVCRRFRSTIKSKKLRLGPLGRTLLLVFGKFRLVSIGFPVKFDAKYNYFSHALSAAQPI